MGSGSDEYDVIHGAMRVKKGWTLDQSRETPGAFRGMARDAARQLAGHGEFIPDPVENDEPDTRPDDETGSDDGPGILPFALGAVGGIALIAAGKWAAERIGKQAPEHQTATTEQLARPAGWYEMQSGANQLRYWDGAAWTEQFARMQVPSAATADWYPDPLNTTQVRYWNGTAWTHHVAARPDAARTPADWYPDPGNAAQVRYWDGNAWTHHVAPRPGASVAVPVRVEPASQHNDLISAHATPRLDLSSAEWQEYFRAWVAAGAVEQELWRRLCHARIVHADPATLEARSLMEQLTPEEGAARVRLMLLSNPSLSEELSLAAFLRFLGGEQRSTRGVTSADGLLTQDGRAAGE